ncbi:putative Cid1 family poly A polymerase [Trypanosoma vivax]|nr:putative Cid1 family poly A polymerase [Trypanosoma vivax]
MELDPRLRAGVLWAKSWGRSQNILNARRGWISPYALTVVCIYFMQVSKRTNSIIDEDTVNDILCDTARVAAGDVGVVHPRCYNILPLRAVNVKDVLDDVRDFFIFFRGSDQFDFDKDVVDIRTRNKIVSKEQWLSEVKDLDSLLRWERLGYEAIMIRDPYEDHNLGRSVDFFRAENIRETFRLASIKNIEDVIFR